MGLAIGGVIGGLITHSAFVRVILILSVIAFAMNNAIAEHKWFWLASSFVATLGNLYDVITLIGVSLCALILTRVHRKEHLGDFKYDRHIPALGALLIMAGIFSVGGLESIVKADNSYAKHIYAGSGACAVIVKFALLYLINYPLVQAIKSGVAEKEEGWKVTAGIMLPFSMSAIVALLFMPSTKATWMSVGMGLTRYAFSIVMCPIIFLTGYY